MHLLRFNLLFLYIHTLHLIVGFEYFNLLHNIYIAIVYHLITDIKNYPITFR